MTAVIFPESTAFIILPFQLMHFLVLVLEIPKAMYWEENKNKQKQRTNKKENCRVFLLKIYTSHKAKGKSETS